MLKTLLTPKSDDIEVHIRHGGKSYIQIKDNGYGMSEEDLKLAFERHATSKLSDQDLFNIPTYGFRGEALPSIASISRVNVSTMPNDSGIGYKLKIEGGENLRISKGPQKTSGTIIEISDLFFATPARLKFLKTDQYETIQCVALVKRMALANPKVAFKLFVDEKLRLNYPVALTQKERVYQVWSKEEALDLRFFEYEKDGLKINGCLSVPSCTRSQNDTQYFFVNGRFVKDKLFYFAIKQAYGDRIPPRRHPLSCVFLEIPYDLVDVNVHPCKTEVRFLEEQLIRRHLCASMNGALSFGAALETTRRLPDKIAGKTVPVSLGIDHEKEEKNCHPTFIQNPIKFKNSSGYCLQQYDKSRQTSIFENNTQRTLNFGQAKAQLHKTYIISQDGDTTYIIDQHAAHERITYERYKTEKSSLVRQKLAIDVSVTISKEQADLLKAYEQAYGNMGIEYELACDTGQMHLIIKSLPSIIPTSKYHQLIKDTLDHLLHYEDVKNIETMIDSILATMACYNSIRKGQELSVSEMNALLREMETTPNIASCNHGRPTYIKLERPQLDRMFERS